MNPKPRSIVVLPGKRTDCDPLIARLGFSIFACMLSCVLAHGQGAVYFRNKIAGQFGAVDAPFFNEQGELLGGSNYVAQLYAWNAVVGFSAMDSPVPFATNGYFFGDLVVVPFVDGCQPVWVQVRAWHVADGATFEQAATMGAWTGVSEFLFLAQAASPSRPELGCEGRMIGLAYPGSPLIVQQPKSVTIEAGEPATLSIIASSGVLMDYQWHQQPSDRPDGLIPNATNSTYTTPALRTNTTFWVSVSNSAGSTVSEQALVTVLATPPLLALEMAGGQPLLTLSGLPGVTYRIDYSTNLSATNWKGLVEVSLTASPFIFLDSTGSNSATRFYRAVAP